MPNPPPAQPQTLLPVLGEHPPRQPPGRAALPGTARTQFPACNALPRVHGPSAAAPRPAADTGKRPSHRHQGLGAHQPLSPAHPWGRFERLTLSLTLHHHRGARSITTTELAPSPARCDALGIPTQVRFSCCTIKDQERYTTQH